jgi:hypothetical protein
VLAGTGVTFYDSPKWAPGPTDVDLALAPRSLNAVILVFNGREAYRKDEDFGDFLDWLEECFSQKILSNLGLEISEVMIIDDPRF